MSPAKTCERIFLNFSKKLRSVLVSHGERGNIRKKEELIEKVHLSDQQEQEIQDYYQTYYRKKIPTHGVDDNGTLKRYAFSEFGEKFDRHPYTDVLFEGYRIGGAGEKLRETVAWLHARVPWLGILFWDLSIEGEGRITLLEVKATGQSTWFPQRITGQTLFGEDTPDMLRLIQKMNG